MQANEKNHSPFVITICQQKGGVGKTTTAVCLGAELANKGKKCLLIDLAPSGNLTSAFGINMDQVNHSIADLFNDTVSIDNLVQTTTIHGLNLIPSNVSLAPIPRDLYQKTNYEHILHQLLTKDEFSDYDILLLDCSPGMDSLIVNAVASADLVILPLVCEYFALNSLDNMFRLIKLSRERVNPEMAYRLLITRMDRHAAHHEQLYAQVKEHYQNALFRSIINIDNKLPESQLAGIPILAYDPKSRATKQYRALTNELIELIDGQVETLKD